MAFRPPLSSDVQYAIHQVAQAGAEVERSKRAVKDAEFDLSRKREELHDAIVAQHREWNVENEKAKNVATKGVP